MAGVWLKLTMDGTSIFIYTGSSEYMFYRNQLFADKKPNGSFSVLFSEMLNIDMLSITGRFVSRTHGFPGSMGQWTWQLLQWLW